MLVLRFAELTQPFGRLESLSEEHFGGRKALTIMRKAGMSIWRKKNGLSKSTNEISVLNAWLTTFGRSSVACKAFAS